MSEEKTGLPRRFHRSDSLNRFLGGTSMRHILGAGFLLKPGSRGYHHLDAPDHYAGVLVLRGRGRYVDWTGREHELRPGSFFQRVPGRKHSSDQVPDGSWAECFVRMGAGLFEELHHMNAMDADRPVLQPGISLPVVLRFEDLVQKLKRAREHQLPGALAQAIALLTDIYTLDRGRSKLKPEQRLVEEACHSLSRNLSERLSMPDLARELGCGYERFRKLFRSHVGVSPGEYRIRRRIEWACSLLAAGDTSVKDVAYQLGYPDAFSFSKQFRRVVGVPPLHVLQTR